MKLFSSFCSLVAVADGLVLWKIASSPILILPANFLDGNDVLEMVQNSSHLLLMILQSIDLKSVRLFIITEWTQGGEDREVFGVFGSELWGIGRSFQREHPDFNLTLIDLHGDWLDLQDSISSTICSLKHDTKNKISRELIISFHGIYKNTNTLNLWLFILLLLLCVLSYASMYLHSSVHWHTFSF